MHPQAYCNMPHSDTTNFVATFARPPSSVTFEHERVMDPACLRHTELPGTSKLFADFSYGFDKVARFYRHNPHDAGSYAGAAREIHYPDDRRAALARVLGAQNPGNPLV